MPNQSTTRTYEPSIEPVFDRLDAWRHFLGDALERRADRIDFETFARHVARHPDPLSQRFSESLLRRRTAAGKSEVQHEFAKVGA
jgi:hypothetical protein